MTLTCLSLLILLSFFYQILRDLPLKRNKNLLKRILKILQKEDWNILKKEYLV